MNSGDIAWVLTATCLVMIMTPALGFFYGGLVRRKNLVSTIVQCLVIFALVSLVWALWGYSIAFAPSLNGIVGDLSAAGLNNVGAAPNPRYAPEIPELLFFAFQLKFAAITPALIIGAFAERIRFKSLLLFIVLWATLIYAPIAHWVWGVGGWLRLWGSLILRVDWWFMCLRGFRRLQQLWLSGEEEGLEGQQVSDLTTSPSSSWAPQCCGLVGLGSMEAAPLPQSDRCFGTCSNKPVRRASAISWMFVDMAKKGKASAVGISVGAVAGMVAITQHPDMWESCPPLS